MLSCAGEKRSSTMPWVGTGPRRILMHKVVLLRHGQSEWNKSNQFTGWHDVDLTEQGRAEAREAGRLLKAEGFDFDVAYTSVLKRAIRTLWIALDEMDRLWMPVHRHWRLNERHYGALQGLNKAETAAKHGEEQVLIWRRSYDIRPPALDPGDERNPKNDRRYAHLTEHEAPLTECLKDTVDRVMEYWDDVIVGDIETGKRVIIAAHGNSLRALVKHLDGMSDDAEVRHERQKNLWEQKIGTEFQYLETKNNMERLQKQLATLRSQANMANTTAPFAGYVDEIFVKRGENAGPGSQLLRLVSLSQVNVVAEISEFYLTKVKRGDSVNINFPSLDLDMKAPITLVGQTINPDNRTFRIEIKLNNPNNSIKPDLLATVKIKNEDKSESIVIPTNLIQNDNIGDFVFVVDKKDKKRIAKKVRVKRGETYDNQTVIENGLKGGEKLIEKGFREVVDGSLIEVEGAAKEKIAKK